MKKLDERQESVTNKVGKISFYVMFLVCAVVITVELIWKGSFENIVGETIVFLAGGITCLAGNIKNGFWTKSGEKMSVVQNLLLSVSFSGIFSVLYVFAVLRKADMNIYISRIVACFFLGITVLCFIVLSVMGKIAQHKKDDQEKKYME